MYSSRLSSRCSVLILSMHFLAVACAVALPLALGRLSCPRLHTLYNTQHRRVHVQRRTMTGKLSFSLGSKGAEEWCMGWKVQGVGWKGRLLELVTVWHSLQSL